MCRPAIGGLTGFVSAYDPAIMAQRYTVILVPAEEGWVSATVPSMPGCLSQGRTRSEAMEHIQDAMELWVEVEAEQRRTPLPETQELVLQGVREAMRIMDDMRDAGELPDGAGYALELATLALLQAAPA
jgi:predicted RNase H-like HicB family nuclease